MVGIAKGKLLGTGKPESLPMSILVLQLVQ